MKVSNKYEITFQEIYTDLQNTKLNELFLNFLYKTDQILHSKILNKECTESDFINFSKVINEFICDLFDISEHCYKLTQQIKKFDIIIDCNKNFIQKKVKFIKQEQNDILLHEIENNSADKKNCKMHKTTVNLNQSDLLYKIIGKHKDLSVLEIEYKIATKIKESELTSDEDMINLCVKYSLLAMYSFDGIKKHKDGILFKTNFKIDYNELIKGLQKTNHPYESISLTSNFDSEIKKKITLADFIYETNYCLHCHKRNKDHCSKGFILNDVQKKNNSNPLNFNMNDEINSVQYKTNQLGSKLTGCPIDQKISEMNLLASYGLILSSIAAAMYENPFLPITGNKICNDCKKSCIFQNQSQVDIPKIETFILESLLEMKFGAEIYLLFTRWNPFTLFYNSKIFQRHNILQNSFLQNSRELNINNSNFEYINNKHNQEIIINKSNFTILVVGMGPGGIALSYYLLKNGHNIVAIDGTKIEKLPNKFCDVNANDFTPIDNWSNFISENSRIEKYGFGGVMEYGITDRWNKHYLKLIRIMLERFQQFRIYDGIRFGSQIHCENIDKFGFDHVAFAIGTGDQKVPTLKVENSNNDTNSKNIFISGVSFASEFLMYTQLSENQIQDLDLWKNFCIKLPIVIIGGGLTAIDTSIHAIKFYFSQLKSIQKNKPHIEKLLAQQNKFTQNEITYIHKLLKYSKIFSEFKYEINNKSLEVFHKLGGIKILYRKNIENSQSYKINHEELYDLLLHKIEFLEYTENYEIVSDKNKCCKSIKFTQNDKNFEISAKTIFIAVGTKPKSSVFKKDFEKFFHYSKDGYFEFEDDYFTIKKTQYLNNISKIKYTCFGDSNPKYNGSVVKAIASAKDGYKSIIQNLSNINNQQKETINFSKLDDLLISKVIDVKKISKNISNIIIQSKIACENLKPGQFFKIQRYNDENYFCEPVALNGTIIDKKKSLIQFAVQERGLSTMILRHNLKIGEKILCMGGLGEVLTIPQNQNILLLGEGIRNTLFIPLFEELLKNANTIFYICVYDKETNFYKNIIKEYTKNHFDVFHFSSVFLDSKIRDLDNTDQTFQKENRINGEKIKSSVKNLIKNNLVKKKNSIIEEKINLMICHCSDYLENLISTFIQRSLFEKDANIISLINSSMYCMMGGICGKCANNDKYDNIYYTCSKQYKNLNLNILNLDKKKIHSTLEKLSYKIYLEKLKKSD